MDLRNKFHEYRHNYVVKQVRQVRLPEFSSFEIRRYRLIFCGRVQNVGFRLEVSEMAKRLGLTGFCRNADDGRVVVEVQGQFDKIKFLVAFMKSLKRIVVKRVEKKRLPINFSELSFQTDKEMF